MKMQLQESLDCYLIGGAKAITPAASLSQCYIVTVEMEQLVYQNFQAIEDFKRHLLGQWEQDLDRSSVKEVLFHHFEKVIEKVRITLYVLVDLIRAFYLYG